MPCGICDQPLAQRKRPVLSPTLKGQKMPSSLLHLPVIRCFTCIYLISQVLNYSPLVSLPYLYMYMLHTNLFNLHPSYEIFEYMFSSKFWSNTIWVVIRNKQSEHYTTCITWSKIKPADSKQWLAKTKKRLHSLILVSFLFNYKKEYSKHSYIFFYTFYLNEGLVLFQVEWSVYHTDVVHSQKPSLKQEAAIPMLHGLQPPIAQNKHLQ